MTLALFTFLVAFRIIILQYLSSGWLETGDRTYGVVLIRSITGLDDVSHS